MRFLCAIVLLEYYIHFTGHVVTSVLFVYIELGNFRMTLEGTDIEVQCTTFFPIAKSTDYFDLDFIWDNIYI